MNKITDLLDTYDQSGSKNIGGNSIISQQINYINALQTYLNTLNNAVNGNCITGGAENKTLNEIQGNCDVSRAGCPINTCSNLNTQGNAITSSATNNSSSNGAQYITFSGDFTLASNPLANEQYADVIANSEKIRKLRNELDLKLKDLNQTPDSRFQEYQDNYNYELLMNITWSILATSIIYYVFIKL